MKRKTTSRPIKKLASQGLVEFALVLPILLLVVIGLMEVGRMMFIYSAANTAARQAVRYGAATGSISSTDPTPRYQDCAGIRAAAKQAGFGLVNIQDADITIQYDTGPGTTVYDTCSGTKDTGISLQGNNVSRINVTVIVHYQPMVTYTPLAARDIRSESARTILNNLTISVEMGTPQLTLFPTLIVTPTSTSTATGTPTLTSTATVTPTLQYTYTPTQTPTITPTPTPTHAVTCNVNYNINGDDGSSFGAAIEIENNGPPITNWTLTWNFSGNQYILNGWNGAFTQNGQNVSVGNLSNNGSIDTGQTLSGIGFNGTYPVGGVNEIPAGISLDGRPCSVNGVAPTPPVTPTPSALCSVDYDLIYQGTSAFTANVMITNFGAPINNWTLTWTFPDEQIITSGYYGIFTQNDHNVSVGNESYNGEIPTNSSQSIRFDATYTDTNTKPASFSLNGMPCAGGIQPTPTVPACDLRHDGLDTSNFETTIYNHGSANVNITQIKITANTNSTTRIKEVLFGGSQLWGGGNDLSPLTIKSPFSGDASLNAANPTTPPNKLLKVLFGKTYVPNGTEQIVVSFDICPELIINP
jgi:Flp pilus assembly protein TadG